MNNIFSSKNHIFALTTVIGTMGGFQTAPAWFQALGKTFVWQILMAAILVYQGGGNLDFAYSLVVATLFYIVIHSSKYIEFGTQSVNQEDEFFYASEPDSCACVLSQHFTLTMI